MPNPYSPEANPFLQPPPGIPDDMFDGPPHSDEEPVTVPVTTRPRQMPGGKEEETDMDTLESLVGSLLPFHCLKTGERFATRYHQGMTCVCGRHDFDLDLKEAMEGDPPLGMMDNYFPPMEELPPNDQFAEPFAEEGPEGLEDQPFNQMEARNRKKAAIARDILISNPEVPVGRAWRLASLTTKAHPVVKQADLAPADANVKVGDIFYSSWGYDQTNVSFYEVVDLKPASVVVRKIQSRDVSEPGNPHESLVPVPGAYIDDYSMTGPTTKRLLGDPSHPHIKIDPNGVEWAWPWDGTPKYQTGWAFGH